jgi:CIC family chloride channel protein
MIGSEVGRRSREALIRGLDDFRLRLSRPDALTPLAVLGVLSGLLAGGAIIAFRLAVDGLQAELLPGGRPGYFEALSPLGRMVLACLGGLALGVLFLFVPRGSHGTGVSHVIERLIYHQGRMPWRNAVWQFLGGAIAIASGQSVGREGPSAHLGAASGALPAQALALPHNALQVLAACGAAAGIAASFNTPLAGVAFAMEVLVMEYTVAGFVPVILASVSATVLSRLVFGHELAFTVPPLTLGSLAELPYLFIVGLGLGAVGALFIRVLQFVTARGGALPGWLRMSLAGVALGLCGVVAPEIMGVGDDTITMMLRGEAGVVLLALVLLVKLPATAVGIGLGVPGGVIGPSLVIGAAAGGLAGAAAAALGITTPDTLGFYALIGMGAMMAGILQAPLAGLIAIVELTGNLGIVFPGMLTVIAATLTCGALYRRESVFLGQIRTRGLDFRNDPISQSLRRAGVAAIMSREFCVLPRVVERARAEEALTAKPRWVVIREDGALVSLLAAVDLVRHLTEQAEAQTMDLVEFPATRLSVASVNMQATLEEARQRMEETGAQAVCVSAPSAPGIERVIGVLTRQDIEHGYHY